MLEPDFIEPDLIDLGAGYFAMGSEGNGENEAPVHRVWIDAFALAKYPVSRSLECTIGDQLPERYQMN